MEKIEQILDFWFEGLTDKDLIDKNIPGVQKWFKKDPAFDQEIKEAFEEDILKAGRGECQDWVRTPKGTLALIILLDQFPRNIYRNTPQMFAYDGKAVELSLKAFHEGQENGLQLIERIFLYMPLQHSEELEMQNLSVQRFEHLLGECQKRSPKNACYFAYTLDFARRHRLIVERFGRFPHRNEILGRASTDKERGFLKMPNSSF